MELHNETLLTGWKDGKLVFVQSYNYATEKEKCQKAINMLAEKDIAWTCGLAEMHLKTDAEEQALSVLKSISEDKLLTEGLERQGYEITNAINGNLW